jgi:hypothetical protein
VERRRLREALQVRRRSVGPAASQREPAHRAEFGPELALREQRSAGPMGQRSAALLSEQVLLAVSGRLVAQQVLHWVGPAARPGSRVPDAAPAQPLEVSLPVFRAAEPRLAAHAVAVGLPVAVRDAAAGLPQAAASAPDVPVPRLAVSGVLVRRPAAAESDASVEPGVLAAPRAAAEQAASDAQVLRLEEAPEAEPWEASAAEPWDARARQQAEPPLRVAAHPSAEAPCALPWISHRLAARRPSALTARTMQNL